jgi:hypothetical protein
MYAKAAIDPWDPAISGKVCIPDDDDQPSFKFTSRIRGTFVVGTGGIGFISANPQAMATSNLNAVISSASAYAGASGGFPGPSGSSIQLALSNGFNNSSSANPFLQRVVSCGLKIRYTGTELNRGGQIIPVKAVSSASGTVSQNDSIVGLSIPQALSRFNTRSDPCSRSWKGTVWTPNTPIERLYGPPTVNDDAFSASQGQVLGVLVTGVAGNTYEYDCICHSELLPNSVATLPSISSSDSDSPSYSFIRNFLGGLYQDEMGQKIFKAFTAKAAKELYRHINPQARITF